MQDITTAMAEAQARLDDEIRERRERRAIVRSVVLKATEHVGSERILCEKLGIARGAAQRWRTGESYPSAEHFTAMKKMIGGRK